MHLTRASLSRMIALMVTLVLVHPAAAQSSRASQRAKADAEKTSSPDARHRDCLAFIHRHGLTCDPWKEPTCGYELGIARPLSCVAP